jgi:hypothetical protein
LQGVGCYWAITSMKAENCVRSGSLKASELLVEPH